MPPRQRLSSRPGSYLERDAEGKFKDWQNVGRSLRIDRSIRVLNESKPGYGNHGDRGLKRGHVVAVKESGREWRSVTGIGTLKRAKQALRKLRRENPDKTFRIFKV